MDKPAALLAYTGTYKSMADGTLRMQVDFQPADATNAVAMFGSIGTSVGVAVVDMSAQESAPAVATTSQEEEFGKKSELLFKSGFFASKDIWPLCGTDDEYLAWLRKQNCAVTGGAGFDADPVVAAHVRRVSSGSGVGIKPQYSAIPLLQSLHLKQHQHGESAVMSQADWDRAAYIYVTRWAAEALKKKLGFDSWKNIPPVVLWAFCLGAGVTRYLPRGYYK